MESQSPAADVPVESVPTLAEDLPEIYRAILDRVADLEMAYNVNDCVELRWGARDNSAEASTCKRHAPRAQRAKMTEYRSWFRERRRPPRA